MEDIFISGSIGYIYLINGNNHILNSIYYLLIIFNDYKCICLPYI